LEVKDMVKDAEMLQTMRKTFMLKQMRAYLKRETEHLKQDIERLRKAYKDAELTFPDDAE
jgi:hypothetical protein